MFVKIKKIELKYENESGEPTGADVAYDLILHDSHLEGNITIDKVECINGWELWKFNRYIFEKIMKSL